MVRWAYRNKETRVNWRKEIQELLWEIDRMVSCVAPVLDHVGFAVSSGLSDSARKRYFPG